MEHCATHTGLMPLKKIDLYRLEQRRTKLHWHFVGRVGK